MSKERGDPNDAFTKKPLFDMFTMANILMSFRGYVNPLAMAEKRGEAKQPGTWYNIAK
jgi:hypothetical protein